MFAKPEEFAKSSFNFAQFCVNTTFDGVERLSLLNLAAARSVFEASAANINKLIGSTDVRAFADVQQAISTSSIERGVEYSRNVIAIASETKDKIAREVDLRVTDANAQVSGLIEKALAAAPAGSEMAVATVKSAIKSAGETYEGLNKAARQAAEMAEASVSAASEATLKAASAIAPEAAGKKAA